ncbi:MULTISPECIES: DUF4145 domain-containing protein [Morganella]|nr:MULTISPECIES: DUF4145 domain-containing protein [Morganella]MBS9569147.1 DUF4145 domain-containing protein [Morganella morganii subsp. morganii]MCJ1905826.1 DUF4145 domain-containing protein [Morganella sp. HSTU-ASny43]QIM76767.1 DUF4145 domain-containing protein [Morganella morganii subsp. morganii]
MGMLSFDMTCPHCLREKAVLTAINEVRRDEQLDLIDITFKCRSCLKVGVAVVNTFGNPEPLSFAAKSLFGITIPSNSYGYKIEEVIPAPKVSSAPDETPERAAKFFIESKDDYQRGRYETSVMNCRKVIDIATKVLMGDEAGSEPLSKRISMLHGKGKITEQMKDWAHIVRIDSNGAVHSDEEFTKEEAEQILGFTEVFLMYSFTLPAMIEKRRSDSK